jgi:hypothetical protein
MRIKKQTQAQKISQIGKVQFDMWIKLSKMSRELRVIQDKLGITTEEEKEEE